MKWHVYVLQCADGSLYTGITTDLERRVIEHNNPLKGAKYTRARQPVVLVYSEKAEARSEAQVREAALKKLSRAEKIKLINSKPRQKPIL
jgi:putative endonuclease